MTDGKMSGDNTVMAWSIRETDESSCVAWLMRLEKVAEDR